MSEYYDRQYGKVAQIREAYELIGSLLDGLEWGWFDRCEECSHPKAMHQLPRFREDHLMPCGSRGCSCDDFADGHPLSGNPLELRRAA